MVAGDRAHIIAFAPPRETHIVAAVDVGEFLRKRLQLHAVNPMDMSLSEGGTFLSRVAKRMGSLDQTSFWPDPECSLELQDAPKVGDLDWLYPDP